MKRWLIFAVVAGAVAVVSVGCSSSTPANANQIEGVISEVTGDLTEIQSFVILDDEGKSHLFTPEQGLVFYGGPLSHLRDHIITGERVVVTFEEAAYGSMTAVLIEHADDDAPHESPSG